MSKRNEEITKQEAIINEIECPDPLQIASMATTTKPDPSTARATLVVEGLSVLGFNLTRAEIGFFKDMHFPIEVKIYETVAGKCKLFWSTKDNFSYSTLGIEINVNPKAAKPCLRYENETPIDIEDFQRMPNLAKWHGARKLNVIKDTSNGFLSARLNVYDATFYTFRMSMSEPTRYEVELSRMVKPVLLDKIGRLLGCNILRPDAEDLEIEFKALNVKDPVTVKLGKTNKPYTIIVRATPNDADNHASHLVHLYNVLQRPKTPTPDPRVYALSFPENEPPFLFCDEIGIESTQFECQTFVGGCGGW